MRILTFFLLLLLSSGLFARQGNQKHITHHPDSSKTRVPESEFIQLTKKGFELGGSPFYPIVLNYMASVMFDGNGMWPCVHPAYERGNRYRFGKPELCYRELVDQFVLIRDMGFNTVRIVDIGEAHLTNEEYGTIEFKGVRLNADQQFYSLRTQEDYEKYFSAIRQLMNALREAGLKCIFTVRLLPEVKATQKHFKKVAEAFQDEPTIIAYDFLNEPLYFDKKTRSKKEVYRITKRWQKIKNKNAPLQLSTIGLATRIEMFEWDPEIVQCDFVSFHPYNIEPDQVMNEIYWYGQHLKKPWIIGETSLPSDNDSVPYQEQVDFAEKVLRQTVSCGGKGFSWWQYSETDWEVSFDNYFGIVTKIATSVNSKGNMVIGKPKPVANVFKEFKVSDYKGNCECPPNYFNPTGQTQYRIIGKLVDENGQPLKSGGILGWDKNWKNSFSSTVKPDGTFSLFSNFEFYHWMVSALEHERIMLDCNFKEAVKIDGIPTLDLGTIQLKKVF